jgi:hypothetical protein
MMNFAFISSPDSVLILLPKESELFFSSYSASSNCPISVLQKGFVLFTGKDRVILKKEFSGTGVVTEKLRPLPYS